jgi:hypothetical protein
MSILVLFLSILLVSFACGKLPTIKDPEMLHNDCAALFEQYQLEQTTTNTRNHPFDKSQKRNGPSPSNN